MLRTVVAGRVVALTVAFPATAGNASMNAQLTQFAESTGFATEAEAALASSAREGEPDA